MRPEYARLDQRHQRAPRHGLIHIAQENLPAGLPAERVIAERDVVVNDPHLLQCCQYKRSR